MLTNNWNSILYKILTGNNAPDGSAVRKDGKKTYVNDIYYKKIVIGSGNTPPKRSDTKLEAEISGDLYNSLVSNNISTDYSKANSYCQVVASVTNASDENIIINEIGLMGTDSFTNFNDEELYLYAREVFDSPITLAPGETKSFVLKLF